MIKNNEPLSMIEVMEYLKKSEDSKSEITGFMKKFIKLKLKETKELKEKIEGLKLMKVKPEQVVKIIDLMPETSTDLNKIFTDISLDEDETKKILETIKEFR